ncbi:MAG: hypothetical protein Ct9H300mP14_06540 [Gammaproteobacteria bacterium]|nr:MAG: hypothetical protein Ct9H300mP14_06540 [Gammaproteobacteria bacterium]
MGYMASGHKNNRKSSTGHRAATAILASLPENLPEDTASDFINCGIAPLCGIEQALDAVEAAAKIGNYGARTTFALPG